MGIQRRPPLQIHTNSFYTSAGSRGEGGLPLHTTPHRHAPATTGTPQRPAAITINATPHRHAVTAATGTPQRPTVLTIHATPYRPTPIASAAVAATPYRPTVTASAAVAATPHRPASALRAALMLATAATPQRRVAAASMPAAATGMQAQGGSALPAVATAAAEPLPALSVRDGDGSADDHQPEAEEELEVFLEEKEEDGESPVVIYPLPLGFVPQRRPAQQQQRTPLTTPGHRQQKMLQSPLTATVTVHQLPSRQAAAAEEVSAPVSFCARVVRAREARAAAAGAETAAGAATTPASAAFGSGSRSQVAAAASGSIYRYEAAASATSAVEVVPETPCAVIPRDSPEVEGEPDVEEELGPTPPSPPFEQDEEELGPTPSSPSFLRAVTSFGSPNATAARQEPDAGLDALCVQRSAVAVGGGGPSTSFIDPLLCVQRSATAGAGGLSTCSNATEAGQEPRADLDPLQRIQHATTAAGGGELSSSFMDPLLRIQRATNTVGATNTAGGGELSSSFTGGLNPFIRCLRPVNTRLRPGDLDEDADLRLPPSPPPHPPSQRVPQAGVQHQQPPMLNRTLSGTTMVPCPLPAAAAPSLHVVRRPPSLLVGSGLPYSGSGAISLGGGTRRSAVGEHYMRPNHWPDTLQVGSLPAAQRGIVSAIVLLSRYPHPLVVPHFTPHIPPPCPPPM